MLKNSVHITINSEGCSNVAVTKHHKAADEKQLAIMLLREAATQTRFACINYM